MIAEAYRCYLLSLGGARIERLPLAGGSLSWSDLAAVGGSGTVELTNPSHSAGDWATHRIGIVYVQSVDGGPEVEYPLGQWVITRAVETLTATGSRVTLELLDKTTLLNQMGVIQAIGYAAGTVVTTAVTNLINQVDGVSVAVPASSGTLRTAMVWTDPQDTLLTVANKLLGTINYEALTVNREGSWVSSAYVIPENRPPRWNFQAERNYSLERPIELDIYSIPNRVIVRSASTDETPGLISIAEDYSSPVIGYNARGQWWEKSYDEEFTSQAVGDLKADQYLLSSRRIVYATTLNHLYIPAEIGEAVIDPSGELAILSSMSINLTPGSLWQSRLRRFVDVWGVPT